MLLKTDACPCCGRDTRREADEHMGLNQLMCRCGRFFCLSCTKNIYDGYLTECPNCHTPLDWARRLNVPRQEDESDSEKTLDLK